MPGCWIGFETPIPELEELRSEEMNKDHPLHVTYLYLGKNYPEAAIKEIDQILTAFSRAYSPFNFIVQDNLEIWSNRYLVKLVSAPDFIVEAREILRAMLEVREFPYDNKYPIWNPHITVLNDLFKRRINLNKYCTNSLIAPCSKIFLKVNNRTIYYYLNGI